MSEDRHCANLWKLVWTAKLDIQEKDLHPSFITAEKARTPRVRSVWTLDGVRLTLGGRQCREKVAVLEGQRRPTSLTLSRVVQLRCARLP